MDAWAELSPSVNRKDSDAGPLHSHARHSCRPYNCYNLMGWLDAGLTFIRLLCYLHGLGLLGNTTDEETRLVSLMYVRSLGI